MESIETALSSLISAFFPEWNEDPALIQELINVIEENIGVNNEGPGEDGMDGDHQSALTSAGFGTDEDYGG
jgi:hypothetical protein